jgi:hypothetical protein
MADENTQAVGDEFGELNEVAAESPSRVVATEGQITVRCGMFPGDILEFSIPAPATIAHAINGYKQATNKDVGESNEVRLNGELVADLDIPITDGDKIYMTTSKSGA